MFYVYLLLSKRDGNCYIGQTDNIKKRLKEHELGLVSSTRNRRPLRLVGYEVYDNRSKARWREYQLKKHGDKKKEFINNLKKKNFLSEP